MLKYSIYDYNQPIRENYLIDICNLVNNSIHDMDNKYDTNVGAQVFYSPSFLDNLRRYNYMNIGTCIDIDPNIDKVIGSCFHYLNPKQSYNNPEWMYDEENPILINSFTVDPEYRNLGIGSQMLNRYKRCYSKSGNYSGLILSADSPNTGAIRLYKRNGFAEKCEYDHNGKPKTIMTYKFDPPMEIEYDDCD